MNAIAIIPPAGKVHQDVLPIRLPRQPVRPSIHRQAMALFGQIAVGGCVGYAVLQALLAIGTPGTLAAVAGAAVGAGHVWRVIWKR